MAVKVMVPVMPLALILATARFRPAVWGGRRGWGDNTIPAKTLRIKGVAAKVVAALAIVSHRCGWN